MTDDVQVQRDYYARTAEHYDALHVSDDDEHSVALAAFCGLANLRGAPASILDIGAGTGRGVQRLQAQWPECRVVGVEPVEALRAIGHTRGIAADALIDGDVLRLDFPDDAFDFVIQTAVLHHVQRPEQAVAEMMRVARVGIMLSDSNRYGQGGRGARIAKDAMRRLRLWPLFLYAQTRGRMSKWSEDDGLYYSYSVFDNLDQIRAKFPRVFVMNTHDLMGTDPRFGSAHAMIFALKT